MALSVAEGNVSPPVPFVADGMVLGPGAPPRQVFAARSGLCAWPFASISPDGREVAYEAVLRRTRGGVEASPGALPEINDAVEPVLRLLDRATGEDSVIAQGACDPVWSTDGRLAYFQGASATGVVGQPYLGTVVVRERSAAHATWTGTIADYEPAAWAGASLFAYQRSGFPNAASNLVVLTGVGRVQTLGNANVTAVRPDGLRALISTVPTSGTNTSERATLRLIRLPDLTELSSLRLDPELEDLARDAFWRGDEVIAGIGNFPGGTTHPTPRLISVQLAGDSLSIAAEYYFDTSLIGPGPFVTVDEPVLVDGTHIGALWSWSASRYLSCDTGSKACVLGPALGSPATVVLH